MSFVFLPGDREVFFSVTEFLMQNILLNPESVGHIKKS